MPPVQSEGDSSSRSSWRPLLWVLPIAILLLGAAAAVGYFVGQSERDQAETEQVTSIVQEQFTLGLVDLEQERYDVARQRFEYIIQLDPSFPEAPERLAEALLGLSEPLAAPTSRSPGRVIPAGRLMSSSAPIPRLTRSSASWTPASTIS